MINRRLSLLSVLAAAVLILGAPPSGATTASAADEFILGLADQAISIVQETEEATDDRRERFRTLLVDGFDVKAIGQFVTGRFWKRASGEERERFLSLFEDMILDTYASRLTDYSGERVEVKSVRDEQDESETVLTEVVGPSGGAPVRVDWRVDRSSGKPRVVDVVVEGVSMALTQRSEFDSVMKRNGGLSGLNAALERKMKRAAVN